MFRTSTYHKRFGISAALFGSAVLLAAAVAAQKAAPKSAGNDLNWWSLRPPKIIAPNRVRQSGWIRNPIDAYVLANLESHGLQPAPAADRTTLIRRATFDMLGVPPTLKEIDAFLTDRSPRAYELLVDRLLADPRYGERWGRHWLDVARFAESQGFERDIIRDHAWRYRDYVIRSFNSDKPYNRFLTEQLAGDALPDANSETIAATGFLVCGPYDEVGNTAASPAVRALAREEEVEDMLSAVGQTFLGMTVNCARCHDHKFDPIPQRDYYRLKAAFDGVRSGNRPCLFKEEMKANDRKTAILRERLDSLRKEQFSLLHGKQPHGNWNVTGVPSPIARWTFAYDTRDDFSGIQGILHNGAEVRRGRLLLHGGNAFMETGPLPFPLHAKTLEAWVVLTNREQRGGAILSIQSPIAVSDNPDTKTVAFDALAYGERQPGKWFAGSDYFRRSLDLDAPFENSTASTPIHIAAVYSEDNRVAFYRNGIPYGLAYLPKGAGSELHTFEKGVSQALIGLRLTGAGNGFLDGEVLEARIYNRALSTEQIAASYQSGPFDDGEIVPSSLAPEKKQKVELLKKEEDGLISQIKKLEQPPLAYAAISKQPEPTYILARGNTEAKGELVTAGGLSAVKEVSSDFGLNADTPEGVRRLRFAEWAASSKNPLTSRVMVNRIWHYHFGRGIVGSPNDFGFNGEAPSNPALLDWLAVVFTQADGSSPYACGWKMKRLHKLILQSNTYRQSGKFNAKAAAMDSENRLLWRFAPKRLEGEAVRDSMLCVSGQINWQSGGPGFRPFVEIVDNSHFYNLFDSGKPEFNRRSVYSIGVNSAKNPLLDTLDCPDPSTKTPKRSITTTPLQALELMNNEFVLRQSREFALRLERESGSSPSQQARSAYRMAFGRLPTPGEEKDAVALIHSNRLETLCWALLNATEFLYTR